MEGYSGQPTTWPVLQLSPLLRPPQRTAVARETASTLHNEMGRWNPRAIERQLAHMEESDVRRAYMHAAEFWKERVI
jgi:hypothetical protein